MDKGYLGNLMDYALAVEMERERFAKIAAWLQWCLDNCDDSPEYNFGVTATAHMKALLAGEDAPGPTATAHMDGLFDGGNAPSQDFSKK